MQLLVNGTVQVDCKNVIVNSSESVAFTTPDFTVDCDTATINASASLDITTIAATIDASATLDLTTVDASLTATATTTTGTITNNGLPIDSTHVHGGVLVGTSLTLVPE